MNECLVVNGLLRGARSEYFSELDGLASNFQWRRESGRHLH
jgi:hypothetical protein